MNKIQNILKDATKDILTEETLHDIESAFEHAVNEKVQLYVEKALLEQDEEYATKLESLLEAIDQEHARKFKLTMESLDRDYANKLIKVVKKYENALSKEAKIVSENLEKNISDYLEIYLEDKIPQPTIDEAVELKRAQKLLNDVRKVLGVNSAIIKESIREAILDGKNQIDQLTVKAKKLIKENTDIKKELEQTKTNLLIEQKTAGLDSRKKEFVVNALKDKSADIIEEEFNYIAAMFDKKEKDRLSDLKQDAQNKSNIKKNLENSPAIRHRVITEKKKVSDVNSTARYMEGI